MNQKGNKSELKEAMKKDLQEKPIEYGVSMPFMKTS